MLQKQFNKANQRKVLPGQAEAKAITVRPKSRPKPEGRGRGQLLKAKVIIEINSITMNVQCY